jgi:hypothetical protein
MTWYIYGYSQSPLELLLQGGEYSVRRLGVAPFTVPTPETTAANEFLTTAGACFVRVHARHVGLVSLKRRRGS